MSKTTASNRPMPRAILRELSDIGTHLSEWRRLQNLTVEELARRSNVSIATIGRLERGGGASLENVLRIARALDVLDQVSDAFDPREDPRGRDLMSARLPQRVRPGPTPAP